MNNQNTIGFLKSHKKYERRIALLPQELSKLVDPNSIYLEKNYGSDLGISDNDYTNLGAHIVSRDVALEQDIICDPKIGESDFLHRLQKHQTVFGWLHAKQNQDITNVLLETKVRAIAWEEMYSDNRHIFWRNNELAGEAAIMHAFLLTGQMPYDTKVAVIGRGNVAFGAIKILQGLGADVTVFKHNQEELLSKSLNEYDVIVNAALWDVNRHDHLISLDDLAQMNAGTLIIDISADVAGGIESSHITTMNTPLYTQDQINHYVIDHTPSLLYRTASKSISLAIFPFLDDLIFKNKKKKLSKATIIENGKINDSDILDFQSKKY